MLFRGEIMSTKQVAATVILNEASGDKKFLLHHDAEMEVFHFIVTDVVEELTGLASILKFMKTELALPVEELHLVELTNVQEETYQGPFFVFSLEKLTPLKNAQYAWEPSKVFRQVVGKMNLSGSPLF